jgi:type I restriction enzyme S subunit
VLGALDDLIETNRRLARALADQQLAEFRRCWDGKTRARLGEVATVTMGQSPPGDTYNESGDGATFYQGVRDFGWRYPSRRVWTTAPTRLAHAGDVLVAVRAPVGELNLAVETTALGRGLGALRSDGRQATLFQALQADPRLWDVHQGTGTVFASINKAGMAGLQIPWVESESLESTLEVLDVAISDLSVEIADLTTTRDELLPLLMSGRVRVREVA